MYFTEKRRITLTIKRNIVTASLLFYAHLSRDFQKDDTYYMVINIKQTIKGSRHLLRYTTLFLFICHTYYMSLQ